MHRSRAPSIAPGTSFVVQSWADCITNLPGFDLRQAQLSFAKLYPSLRRGELIDGTSDPRFRDAWTMARADTFSAIQ
jgi:hypothetical protein